MGKGEEEEVEEVRGKLRRGDWMEIGEEGRDEKGSKRGKRISKGGRGKFGRRMI